MVLPRLAKYEINRIYSVVHIVLVDGDENKLMCIRHVVKKGQRASIDAEVNCGSCKGRGWVHSLGPIGAPVEVDQQGRFLSRT